LIPDRGDGFVNLPAKKSIAETGINFWFLLIKTGLNGKII